MSTQIARTSTPAIHFAVPVWGERYVDVFVNVSLPAQLSPNNIPALKNNGVCQYHIYTTTEDYGAIYGSRAFKLLEKYINCSIHVIDAPRTITDKNWNDRYTKKSDCYRHAIHHAAKHDAANFLLNADIILADGFVKRSQELLATGKRVIEMPGPRALEAPLVSALQDYQTADGVISIPSRDLTRLAIKNLHPLMDMHVWGSEKAESSDEENDFHPSHLYWRIGAHSLFARCFHLYPIVIFPRDQVAALNFDTTIDDDLVERACPSMDDTHVVTDSDEMFCCELSPPHHYVGKMARRGDVDSVVNFYFRYGKRRNWKLLKYKIRMIGGIEEAGLWKQAERESETVVSAVVDKANASELYESDADILVPAIHRSAVAREKPKVRFLLAIWGAHHTNLFLKFALPSLLAPGNIPAIAEEFDCDFEILTMREDISRFRLSAAISELRKWSRVHVTEIDDLRLRHAYGVLLTYAFARGIAGQKDEMTNTHFIFLNADFVFSDGSLKSVVKAIQEGYTGILAPSFRCVSEDFCAQMESKVNPIKPVLQLSGREMARVAFDLIHPTFKAKTINQDEIHTKLVNQFLWKVDDDTMLGRFFLMFMLCIKPEKPLEEVSGFCDYTFINDLVPSGNIKIFHDSDDIFILELQHRDHEGGEFFVPTRPGKGILARQLSEWSTVLHRRYADLDLVFHAQDIPGAVSNFKKDAASFLGEIGELLGPPQPYVEHQYWRGTFAALHIEPDGVPIVPVDGTITSEIFADPQDSAASADAPSTAYPHFLDAVSGIFVKALGLVGVSAGGLKASRRIRDLIGRRSIGFDGKSKRPLIATLTAAFEEKQKALADVRRIISRRAQKIAVLRADLRGAQSGLADKSEKLAAAEQTLSDLRLELRKLEDQIQRVQAESNAASVEIEQLRQRSSVEISPPAPSVQTGKNGSNVVASRTKSDSAMVVELKDRLLETLLVNFVAKTDLENKIQSFERGLGWAKNAASNDSLRPD